MKTAREVGFAPAETWQQAISQAGDLFAFCGPRNPHGPPGVIRSGSMVDLLIVDGNPLEDISALTNPTQHLRLTMKSGTIHEPTL